MTKIGGIYYTDNRLDPFVMKICQDQLREAFGEDKIVSVSLKPMDFGKNIVLENRQNSYPTMVAQIVMALEKSDADVIFHLEHDVLYPKSHFDFEPPKPDVFYYNDHVWRWRYWENKGDNMAITYFHMLPLSCLCVNRQYGLEHFKFRQQKIKEMDLCEWRSREPRMARIWGYEPGTKKKRNGGLTDLNYDTWHSEYPVVDVRHGKTFSRLKCTLADFKHPPVDWREIPIEEIPGWNLRSLFKI